MRVTSAEFIKKYGSVTDAALSEPVTITRNGRPRLVLISADEYERLKRRDRRVVSIEDITDDDLKLIEESRMEAGHEELDEEHMRQRFLALARKQLAKRVSRTE